MCQCARYLSDGKDTRPGTSLMCWCLRYRICLMVMMHTMVPSGVDPDPFDTDPAFHFDMDPDPAFQFDMGPDLTV